MQSDDDHSRLSFGVVHSHVPSKRQRLAENATSCPMGSPVR